MAAHQFPSRYSGKRWPYVKVTERFQSYEPPDDPTGDPKPVSCGKTGSSDRQKRVTSIEGAAAFWRTFGELDMNDDDRNYFVRRPLR